MEFSTTMTGRCRLTSFFASFRLLVWKLLEFQENRTKTLHPAFFNCRRCDRQEKDLLNDCPKCELMTMQAHYKGEAVCEILERVGRFPIGWTLEQLIALYGEVGDLLAGNRNRINKKWNVRVIRLAEILKGERDNHQAVSDYEHHLKMQQTGNTGGQNLAR